MVVITIVATVLDLGSRSVRGGLIAGADAYEDVCTVAAQELASTEVGG